MDSIESLLFEFLKRKAFLQMGVGIRVFDFQYTPIQEAQDSIYSLQLIALYSVFDKAVDTFFQSKKLKDERRKSRFQILREKGFIEDNRAKYLLWYKDWRNDAAHHFKVIQYFELQQATEDVQKQLLAWSQITQIWDIRHYWVPHSESQYSIGARVDNIPILVYEITYNQFPNSPSPTCSYGKKLDLSLNEYRKLTLKTRKSSS